MKKISEHYREIHRSALAISRLIAKNDRPASFRLLEQAKTARLYFSKLRSIPVGAVQSLTVHGQTFKFA